MHIQTNHKLEFRRLILKKRRLEIQKQQLGIIPVLSHFYMATSNSYALSPSSLNTTAFKPYIARHISPEWNLKNKISRNKVEDEMSRDVGIESIDYERD